MNTALQRGDRVQVVHVYDERYAGCSGLTGVYEVILVDGVYVQLFGGRWPRTRRFHAKSVEDLNNAEVTLRPAHDAVTPGWGYSVRVRRVKGAS